MGAKRPNNRLPLWHPALLLVFLLVLTACTATTAAPPVKRIALLAPFEGRYREIGYDAIYPIRLALNDAQSTLVLVTADDGGTVDSAIIQAKRLSADQTILAALVIGPIATDPAVLTAFSEMPVITVGLWNAVPAENTFILASEKLSEVRTNHAKTIGIALDTDAPVTGGELFALKQYAKLRPNLTGVTVALSAVASDVDFADRLVASDLFVPAAGALSTVAYDASGLINSVAATSSTRAEIFTALETVSYDGINGRIAFTAERWWEDAPIVEYGYENNVLTSPAP